MTDSELYARSMDTLVASWAAYVRGATDAAMHRTASVQSTKMAEHMYAGVGFRDLGRILEYVP